MVVPAEYAEGQESQHDKNVDQTLILKNIYTEVESNGFRRKKGGYMTVF